MNTFNQVWAEIKKHKSFLIVSHQNPDADAACSSLAMGIVLKKMGKKVTVANEDVLPGWLTFLPQTKDFQKKSEVKEPSFDCVIILDCGDFPRIGKVAQWIKGQKTINIDHHITNESFGNLNIVLPKSSSTCEILFDLFQAGKVKLTKELAVHLYAGIMTDTGCFRYDNTSWKTHEVAAQLLKQGLSAADLYRKLFVGIPSADMKVFVDTIHNAELMFKNKVYCVPLPKSLMLRFSKKFDLKEKLFAFLRTVEGIEVVVILSELTPHQTRINLRSQNDFDVAQLASKFNGGGHRKAAGAMMNLNLEDSKKKILAAIRKGL